MSTAEDLEVLQVRATVQVTYLDELRRLTASLVRYTQILRSLPPLLSPDLPSPPPSRPASPIKVEPAPLERKHEEDGHRNGEEPSQRPTIGLGFEEGLDEVAAKCVPNELHNEVQKAHTLCFRRPRPAPPPPPAPPGRPPPPPPAALPSDLKPSTPDLRNSPRPASARLSLPKGSPMLGSPRVDREAEWRKEWPKERLRKLAAQCVSTIARRLVELT